ncbi:MAG: ribonuclease E/G [Pseudomonadota bacterium]
MAISQILLETRLFERRAVALSGEKPATLFHDSPLIDRGPRLGTHHAVCLRETPAGLDGGFCETPEGETVFVRFGKSSSPALGTRISVEIVAEAHGGKAARGQRMPTETPLGRQDVFEAWCGQFYEGVSVLAAESQEQYALLDEAFDEALAPSVTLQGGGRLGLARTPALTAVDIDTSGRKARGGRRRLAEDMNLQAARELARQVALRGLGGLIVMDCVAPITKTIGGEIKAAFLGSFRDLSARRAQALAPSPFGLMEISLAWAECPIEEVLGGAGEVLSPIGQLLEGLRLCEREILGRPAPSLTLAVPVAASEKLQTLPGGADRLAKRFAEALGPSLNIEVSPTGRVEVVRP